MSAADPVDACAIDRLVATLRAEVPRVRAVDLAAELAGGALVIDTRPVDQRERDGELPGAIVVDRNVLEWRLDPTSPDRLAASDSTDLRVVVVCNEGYSSSLAAHTLRQIGLHRATDLEGGFQAWRAHAATWGTAGSSGPDPVGGFGGTAVRAR